MKPFARLFIAVAAVAAFVSCSSKTCKVQGTVGSADNLKNGQVLIVESKDHVDTLSVVDGKFSCTLPRDEARMYNAILFSDNRPYRRGYSVQFVTDAKSVKVVLDSVSHVEGSALTDLYNDLRKKSIEINRAQGYDAYLEFSKQAYMENSQSIVGEKIFFGIARDLSVAELDECMAVGSDRLRESENLKRMRATKLAEEASAVGSHYLDFSGVTPDGKAVNLSDFVGRSKLTLVDFWASWCGPCMRSMPGMVRLWNSYHKKGLDIVGVAVWDGDNSASRKSIEAKGMLWPQILTGEDKTSTEIYGISGIPHVLLIDADGTILLRGVPDEKEIETLVSAKLK